MDTNDLQQADAAALTDRIGSLLAVVRSAEAEIGALLVEIESRGAPETFGYRSAAQLYAHLADVPKATADAVMRRARAMHSPEGGPTESFAPATKIAASAGQLSTPMIDAIVKVMAQVPPEHREDTEHQLLLSAASEAGHRKVAALGSRLLSELDPGDAEPTAPEPATPPRKLSLRRKRSGTWELSGRFDDETGNRASALLDALAERRAAEEGEESRTSQERYGDAFSDAIDLALDSPDLPMQYGDRVQVLLPVPAEGFDTAQSTLDDTPAAENQTHAHADADPVTPAATDETTESPAPGRLRRLITTGFRHAGPERSRRRLPHQPQPTTPPPGPPRPAPDRWQPDTAAHQPPAAA
ncbi:hypothetical protein H4696_005434 [Amycolatopsis lexingtonensis]|uniref:DUF222 domain-containing protein n=1 Tax=Amycolatopsis lexingtonensis TaxID=218822 RepID=A0ABR9I587_9PSEU|nr:DUF222 domain-containing protein [Amycolatopsis lexingtonensis]MBE1498334.1 hypothetical protein [Amycolatopsis lexingtonensis]